MPWPTDRSLDGGLDRVPLPTPQGSIWLCGKRVVAPDPTGALRRAGADVIVSFNERPELLREYPDYVAWLDDNLGRRSRWFPIPDLGAPPVESASDMVDELATLLYDGAGLILHCAGGIGRAPTMAVCVLIRLGVSSADALELVARSRPSAGPEAGPQHDLVAAFR